MPVAPEAPAGVAQFHFPTRVRFGLGAIAELAGALGEAGVRKALVVTDGGLVDTEAFAAVRRALEGCAYHVYAEVAPNPLAEQVDRGAEAFAAEGCDGIVAVGGGSALDVAKVIRILARHGGRCLDYAWSEGGGERITDDQPFLVAVPTTAGTGSEVGRSSVVTDPRTRRKISIFSPHMMPPLVLCDPELTRGLPPAVTANTGIDALTHAVEAYLTPAGYQPLCDGIALRAIGMVGGALRRAVEDGGDMAARSSMMAAALMGAVAFQKGLGATHALAHPLSTLAGLPHGLANGVLLPHVLRFNADAVEERVRDVGLALDDDEDAPGAVARLARDVGLPRNLSEAGVPRDLLEELVAQALQEHLLSENPRPLEEADVRRLYEAAFDA
ncbi:MAG: iron-containing alcohol dehydrogenase [Planctomycetota bacterium]|nr:MAG: iron-containing alcohol dehydrogenase [Planctomycetota bacterium]